VKVSNSDGSNQTSATVEDLSTVPSGLPADIFYNLILQMLPELKPQPPEPLTLSTSSVSPALPDNVIDTSAEMKDQTMLQLESTTPSQPSVTDNHSLLTQLNFVSNNQVKTNVPETPKTKSVEKNSIVQTKSAVSTAVIEPQLINKDAEKIIAEQPILTTQMNLEKKIDYSNVEKEIDYRSLGKELDYPVNQADPLLNNNVTPKIDAALAPQIIPAKIAKPAVPAATHAMNTVLISPVLQTQNTEQATNQIHPSAQTIKLALPVNKPLNTFTQLSHFINSYTMPASLMQLSPSNMSDANMARSTDGQVRNSQHYQYEPKIEILSSSIDSLMKESYDAKIKIYPPELGHVTAKLRMDKDNGQLILLTESSRVKEIVEANLPQLQQHFKDANINVTQIQVQPSLLDTPNQQDTNQRHANDFAARENTIEPNEQKLSPNEKLKDPNTLIDTYA